MTSIKINGINGTEILYKGEVLAHYYPINGKYVVITRDGNGVFEVVPSNLQKFLRYLREGVVSTDTYEDLSPDMVDDVSDKADYRSGDIDLDSIYEKYQVADERYCKFVNAFKSYRKSLESRLRRLMHLPLIDSCTPISRCDARALERALMSDHKYRTYLNHLEKLYQEKVNTGSLLMPAIRHARLRGVKYPRKYYQVAMEYSDGI